MGTVLLQVRGVALVTLLAAAPVAMARVLLGRRTAARARRPATRLPGRRRSPGAPARRQRSARPRRPLEAVAADLRRLDRQFSLVASGAPLVRWRALWAAYDQVLIEAAEQLEVPHTLPQAPVGIPRDIERLRVVSALEARGLVVRG